MQEYAINFQEEQPVKDDGTRDYIFPIRLWSLVRISLNTLLDTTRAFTALWKKQIRVHRGELAKTISFITHFSWSHRLLSLIHPSQQKHLGWGQQFLTALPTWMAGRQGTTPWGSRSTGAGSSLPAVMSESSKVFLEFDSWKIYTWLTLTWPISDKRTDIIPPGKCFLLVHTHLNKTVI